MDNKLTNRVVFERNGSCYTTDKRFEPEVKVQVIHVPEFGGRYIAWVFSSYGDYLDPEWDSVTALNFSKDWQAQKWGLQQFEIVEKQLKEGLKIVLRAADEVPPFMEDDDDS